MCNSAVCQDHRRLQHSSLLQPARRMLHTNHQHSLATKAHGCCWQAAALLRSQQRSKARQAHPCTQDIAVRLGPARHRHCAAGEPASPLCFRMYTIAKQLCTQPPTQPLMHHHASRRGALGSCRCSLQHRRQYRTNFQALSSTFPAPATTGSRLK